MLFILDACDLSIQAGKYLSVLLSDTTAGACNVRIVVWINISINVGIVASFC